MKIISTFFYSFFILLLTAVVGLFLLPLLPIHNTVELRIVESGSMEPFIHTGAVVFVKKAENYQQGDVITFKSVSASIPTTHRITNVRTENGATFFSTKGDANEDNDTNETSQESVIGKVYFSVPYAGFILDFARKPLGFALLIVLPAFLLIISELEKIWTEIKAKRTKKTKDDDIDTDVLYSDSYNEEKIKPTVRMMDIGTPVYFATHTLQIQGTVFDVPIPRNPQRDFWIVGAIILACFCVVGLSSVGTTVSYFTDTEASLANVLQASMLDFSVIADGDEYTFLGTSLDDEDDVLLTVITPEEGTDNVVYDVFVQKIDGTDAFCSVISASSSVPFIYDGKILLLSQNNVAFDIPWAVGFSLSSSGLGYSAGDECVVDIVYKAHTQGVVTGGYSDEERIRLEFYAPIIIEPLQAPIPLSLLLLEPFEEILDNSTITTEEGIPPVEEEGEVVEEEVVLIPEIEREVPDEESVLQL